jgi:hypothetical protein
MDDSIRQVVQRHRGFGDLWSLRVGAV